MPQGNVRLPLEPTDSSRPLEITLLPSTFEDYDTNTVLLIFMFAATLESILHR